MVHKIGIALGGGVAKGWTHIGVLETLIEHGIVPDVVAGTSIGAVVGGCYAAGRLDELKDFALGLTRRNVLGLLDINLKGSSLLSGRRISNALEDRLGDTQIQNLEKKFIAVSAEIGTGHEIWLDKGRLVDAMRASYALPGIFQPVHINGHWLFDGALVNPVPITACRALGATIVIAVNINEDMYGKSTVVVSQQAPAPQLEEQKEDPTLSEKPTISITPLNWFKSYLDGGPQSVPGLSKTLMEALNITQNRIAAARLAGDPPDMLLTPRVNDIGLFDFHKAKQMIEIGNMTAEANIHHINRLVANLPKLTNKPASASGDIIAH